MGIFWFHELFCEAEINQGGVQAWVDHNVAGFYVIMVETNWVENFKGLIKLSHNMQQLFNIQIILLFINIILQWQFIFWHDVIPKESSVLVLFIVLRLDFQVTRINIGADEHSVADHGWETRFRPFWLWLKLFVDFLKNFYLMSNTFKIFWELNDQFLLFLFL